MPATYGIGVFLAGKTRHIPIQYDLSEVCMYIFFNDERLLDVSLQLKQIRSSLDDELKRIQRLLQEMEGDWQSEAQRALASKIICVSNYYEKVILMCDNLSGIISHYVNSILEIDSLESTSLKNL